MKISVGSRVKMQASRGAYNSVSNGTEGTVISEGGDEYCKVSFDDTCELNVNYQDLKLINKKMNIKDSFTLAFKKEPEKSFRKTGITNGDDFLTEDGQKIFLSWLLKKHGEEFKTEVVDDLLKEQESESK